MAKTDPFFSRGSTNHTLEKEVFGVGTPSMALDRDLPTLQMWEEGSSLGLHGLVQSAVF